MYNHILFATDLTETSKIAAHKAWELANQFKAKLTFIHIIEPLPAYGYPGVTTIEAPFIDQVSDQLADYSKEFSIPADRQIIELGTPKFKINEYAQEKHIDLIIVASHSKKGLQHLLGSTANAILHAATCDVVTVKIK